MLHEHIQTDTFTPPLHTLPDGVRKSNNYWRHLNHNLHRMKSIGTIHLTKMQIDMGDSESVAQRPYPIAMKHYDWVMLCKVVRGQDLFISFHILLFVPYIFLCIYYIYTPFLVFVYMSRGLYIYLLSIFLFYSTYYFTLLLYNYHLYLDSLTLKILCCMISFYFIY